MAPFNDFPRATAGLVSAQSPHAVTLDDGERFSLRIGPVAKTLAEHHESGMMLSFLVDP